LEASAIHAPSGLGRITAHGPLLRLRTDDQLVALFRMGYDDAFRAIHDRYRQRLFAYTRQMLAGARSDAEDVLQDVFLRAYGALRDDDRPVTLRAWLYRVAHNRCIDHLRRPAPPAAEVYDLSRPPVHEPADATERREDLRRLVQDVQRLPEQQRSALLMRELDGLSYAELADALRTSIPAVKSLLVRARIGLVEAGEARDAACAEIRSDLALALRRGVRASGRSRRHLRDCQGCREYRRAMRSVDRGLAALAPSGGGPLATIAKLLGVGGASSGAAAGAGMGGSAAVVGGATAATATKVAAIVCCAAVVGGGAVEVRDQVSTAAKAPKRAAAKPARAAAVRAAPTRTIALGSPAPQLLGRREAAVTHRKPARHRVKALVDTTAAAPATHAPASSAVTAAAPEEAQTGGTMAPDEDPAAEQVAPTGTEGESSASAPTSPSSPTTASDPPAAPVDTAPADPAAGSAGGTGEAGGPGAAAPSG
jgi:RNA polymerase sigma factor (sigma-70 family)